MKPQLPGYCSDSPWEPLKVLAFLLGVTTGANSGRVNTDSRLQQPQIKHGTGRISNAAITHTMTLNLQQEPMIRRPRVA